MTGTPFDELGKIFFVVIIIIIIKHRAEHYWLTLGAHARGLQYLSCLSVCVCVCVFSLFWHLV